MKTLPHLVTANDIFCNFNVDKLKGEGNIKRKYKCADKMTLVKKIFLRYLFLLMTDMVEGGKVFLFPNRKHMELRFRRIPDHYFKRARQAGTLMDVNILMTEFKFYELVLSYKIAGVLYERPIKLNKAFMNRIIEKANTGFKYC